MHVAGKNSTMKSILIAIVTVGATIAGLIIYTEQKMKRNALQPKAANEPYPTLEKENVEPLAIQSIP